MLQHYPQASWPCAAPPEAPSSLPTASFLLSSRTRYPWSTHCAARPFRRSHGVYRSWVSLRNQAFSHNAMNQRSPEGILHKVSQGYFLPCIWLRDQCGPSSFPSRTSKAGCPCGGSMQSQTGSTPNHLFSTIHGPCVHSYSGTCRSLLWMSFPCKRCGDLT